MRRNELEDRMVAFATMIIKLASEMPQEFAGKHLAGQIIRSGTSAALNYGEAQAGESRKDFVHKMKVALKELRETLVCLKIIHSSKLFTKEQLVLEALKENDELISIFVTSVKTAMSNMDRKG